MSGPDDARLPRTRLPGDDGTSLTPPPTPEELPGESDRTIELPLGLTVDFAAEAAAGANGGPARVPHHDSVEGPGSEPPPAELFGETPTAPLPVDIDVDMDAGEPPRAALDGAADFADSPGSVPHADDGHDLQHELEDALDDALEDALDDAALELVDGAGPDGARSSDGVSDRVVLTPPPVPGQAVSATAAATARANQATPITPPPVTPAVAVPAHIPPLPPQELLQPTEAWAEPLSQRPRRKRLKPWFEEVFDEDYLRTLPFMTAEQTLREVSFIRDGLNPPADGELLDVACGYGRHAIELSQRGLKVTGIDLSLPLLIRAADESQRRGLSVNFVHADMRELTFENQFDGAYCMLTSFGYFDEETNLKVATGICRALKPGGRLLLDTVNRDYIVGELPTRVWWEGDGCLVLEEVDFNYHTSRLSIRRSVVFQDGRQLEHDISIRSYSLHELGKLMRQAGFRVVDVSGSIATRGHFFGATSRNLIVVCEKAG